MVGVPGKSRGCHTCRRRKIKCDQGQPSCENCTSSDRTCEGYKTFPVFLNRTVDGLQRRQRFEEMQPSASSLSSAASTSPALSSKAGGGRIKLKRDRFIIYSQYSTGLVSRHVSLSPIEDQAYIDLLCLNYLPDMRRHPANWLDLVAMDLPNLDPVFKTALKALTLTNVAVTNSDTALSMRGRESYGAALKLLQRYLSNPKTALHDMTITLIRIVAFYELLAGRQAVDFPWISHQLAIEALLRAQGPKSDRSPIEAAMFYESRRQAFCRSLMQFDPMFLERPEWRVRNPDLRDQLYNIGFQALGTYVRVQKNVDEIPAADAPGLFQQLFVRCVKLLNEFRQWRIDLDKGGPFCTEVPTDGKLKTLVFDDFDIADDILHFWTMLLLLALAIKVSHDRFGLTDSLDLVTQIEGLVTMASGGLSVSQLAANIFRSVPYFLQEGMGAYAVVRSAVPLAMAARVYRVFGIPLDDQLVKWVDDVEKALVRERLTIIPFGALIHKEIPDLER